jgi:hypothetical protein
MITCNDARERVMLGLDPTAVAHLRSCERCRAEVAGLESAARTLAAAIEPTPPPSLSDRLLAAAQPLLARNAQRHLAWTLVRALAVALLPLPAIVLVDFYVLQMVHDLLSTVLPPAISTYLVVQYGALLALLLAATYAAIPFLVERQARLQHEVVHA